MDGQLKAYLKYTRTTVLRITDLPLIKKGQSQNSHRKKKEILPLNEGRVSMGQDAENKKGREQSPARAPSSSHLQVFLLVNETITFIVQARAHERVKGEIQ